MEEESSLLEEENSKLLIIIVELLLLNRANNYVVGATSILKGVKPSSINIDWPRHSSFNIFEIILGYVYKSLLSFAAYNANSNNNTLLFF